MADRVGQQLGNYRLTRLLGRGGFADVYLGEHQRLNTLAAIKVLHTQLTEDDEQGFLQEARIIAHLEHRHIVRVLDFDVVEGVPYLVMQYAPNGNLRQLHPKGSILPLETILSYIVQITDALQYAHDERLIHRDIKPENMLLGRNHDIILSDFGIALIVQSSHLQSTQDLIGTFAYMAPEQLQGKPRFASDQYALGVVVYEWLCGTRPFYGNAVELFSQHMFVPPPPLHEKMPDISPEVEQVVLKALAKEANQRFASVKIFANALKQANQPKPLLLTAMPFVVSTPSSVLSKNESSVNDTAYEVDEQDVYQDQQTNIGKNIDEEDSEEDDLLGLSHIHNTNLGKNSPGNTPVQPDPPEIEDADEDVDEDELVTPIYSRPTLNNPSPVPVRQTKNLKRRDFRPSSPRPLAPREVQPLPNKQSISGQKASAATRRGKKQSISISIPMVVAVLIILLIGLVAFLWPSADVTMILPSHNYPVQMSLTAKATSRQDTALKTLPAQTLVFDTSVIGTGHATGSTTVGTIQADGNVTFSNNDKNSQVAIPSNTVVATKGGVQFLTQAEGVVVWGSPLVVPVSAQNAGASGNVPAGSITVIPAASLTAIQQANPSGTVVNLSVTNTDATAHGGAGSATSLTTGDVNTEKSALDIQLQTRIKEFLAKNVQTGDQVGQPILVETPLPTPAVGSVVNSGTFTEMLKLHMTVLVVRATDLQAAVTAEINDTLVRSKTNLALVPQQSVQITQIRNNSPTNGSLVVLSLTAVGQVMPQVSQDMVRNLVAGKSVSDAQQALVGNDGIPNIIHMQITVSPSFFHWLPFWKQRINVHFLAVPQAVTSMEQ